MQNCSRFIFLRMVIFYLHYTYISVTRTFSLSGPVPAPFGWEKRGSSVLKKLNFGEVASEVQHFTGEVIGVDQDKTRAFIKKIHQNNCRL